MDKEITSFNENSWPRPIPFHPGFPFPQEIILHIFSYLNLHEICPCTCVCHFWYQITSGDNFLFWKNLCGSQMKLQKHTWKDAALQLLLFSRVEENRYKEFNRQIEQWKSFINATETPGNSSTNLLCYPIPEKAKNYKQIGNFKSHPLSSTKPVVNLSVDLFTAAKDYYCLLYMCKARDKGSWTNSHYISGTLQRYYKFMKLKQQYPDTLLIPTMDIEYIWCAHLTRPSLYNQDCKNHFGGVIPHKLRLNLYETLVRHHAIQETALLWQQHYGETYGVTLMKEESVFDPLVGVVVEKDKVENKEDDNEEKFSGSWVGTCHWGYSKIHPINIHLTFSKKGKIQGNSKNSEISGNCKNGKVIWKENFNSQKYTKVYTGTIKGCTMEGEVKYLGQVGQFLISRQIIPSGVWEGYVCWVSGSFHGQPLTHIPEKMRLFLIFDHTGAIFGGGTQRNNFFDVRISGTFSPKTGKNIFWTKTTLQRSTGAMNGCNSYQGLFLDNTISGTITRTDTDWVGKFSITFLGTGIPDEHEAEPIHQWVPQPNITKLTTEVSYLEQLWKEEKKDSPVELPPLSISIQDIKADSDWLTLYCQQVFQGLYYYPDDQHLMKSIKGYEKLLFLAAKYPSVKDTLHQTFAIDLIWHAHQVHPREYNMDCMSLLGYELDYQPWPEETIEKEDERILATDQMWAEEFGDEMYRKS